MVFFLCNALGFFIQFFPCMLMIFLPFSEESLRFPRKWIFIGITLTVAILAVVFPWALHWADGNAAVGTIANFYMLCSILLGMLAFVLLICETMTKKFLAFYSVLFYAVAQYYLVSIVSNFFDGFSPFTAYSD